MKEANFPSTHAGQTLEPVKDDASSSATATVINVFIEPGRLFESLRKRPRFLVAALVMAAVTFTFTTLLVERVGYENVVRAKIEALGTAGVSGAQKEQIIQIQSRPFLKVMGYGSSIVNVFLLLLAGGFLYQLGSMTTTRPLRYKQALSVWTYSSLPPTVLVMLLNIVILFMTPTDRIDPLQAGKGGLVRANLGVLVDATEHPVFATAGGSLDLFALYGLILGALGLQKVAGISSRAAWSIVLGIWMGGVVIRSLYAAYTGTSLG